MRTLARAFSTSLLRLSASDREWLRASDERGQRLTIRTTPPGFSTLSASSTSGTSASRSSRFVVCVFGSCPKSTVGQTLKPRLTAGLAILACHCVAKCFVKCIRREGHAFNGLPAGTLWLPLWRAEPFFCSLWENPPESVPG